MIRQINSVFIQHRFTWLFLWLPVCFVLFSVPVFTQSYREAFAMDGVSDASKSLLVKQIDLAISLERGQRWSERYRLSLDYVLAGDGSRDKFISSNRTQVEKSNLVDFVATSADIVDKEKSYDLWLVNGCGIYLRDGQLVFLKSATTVTRKAESWYIDLIRPLHNGVDGGEMPCRFSVRRN